MGTEEAWPNNLPVQLTSFIGREQEMAEVRRLMAENRLLTLTGSGGCGKSRLALQVVSESHDDHPDGAWWVDLAPMADPALVAQAMLTTLGLRDAKRPPLEHLTDYIGEQRLLIVLDNCEHLLATAAEMVHAMLSTCLHLMVLTTSREPLGVQGEQTWRVPSLSIAESTRLFSDRAARARPNFRLTEDIAADVAVICQRLDGIPLAIELAAARTRALSAPQIAAGIDDRFRLLTGGPRTVTARHQTLLASVAWSHDLLSPAERALFRRLAVFAGGFTLDAAEEIAGSEGVERLAVLDLLTQLVDKSLVVMDEGVIEARFRLLETVRQYAADRLIDAGETPAVRSRHLAFYCRLAETAEAKIEAADGPVLDTIELECDNVRSALQWALLTDPSAALRLVVPLSLFWYQRGHYREGRQRLREALDAATDSPVDIRSRALWGLGHLTFYDGDYLEGYELAQQALERAQAGDDDRAIARALGLLAWVEMFVDPVAARTRLDAAIPLSRRVGDQWSLADNLQAMGWTYVVQEDHEAARPYHEEAAAVAACLGNPYFLAWNGAAFGQAMMRTGDYAEALTALEGGIAASRAVGEPDTLAWCLGLMCEAKVARGDYDGGLAALEDEGLQELHRIGSGPSHLISWMVAQHAQLPLALDKVDDARALLQSGAEMARAEGASWPLMQALCALGKVEVATGNATAARAAAEEAAEISLRLGNEWCLATTRHVLGLVAQAEGALAKAETLLHEALALRAARGYRPDVVDSLEALAGLAAEYESWVEAARLFAAAERLRDEIGLLRWPACQSSHDAAILRTKEGAGAEPFDLAWREGSGLSLGDAVAYVRRSRGERKRPSAGWASLTPTEHQVVRLAAQGLTNPQIGQQLFMSLGTVKTHLSHVFAKLGVSTRAELVAETVRRPD